MNADEMTDDETFELLQMLGLSIASGALLVIAIVYIGHAALEQSVLESLAWAAGASVAATVAVPCMIYTVACRYYRAELEAADGDPA